MSISTVGVIAAAIGVVATGVWIVLGVLGVKWLRDIRDQLRPNRRPDQS